MAHVRPLYRTTLTLGILSILAGCGGDASQADLAALRAEVAEIKQTQVQMKATLDSLQSGGAAARTAGAPAEDAEAKPKREAVRRIPVDFAPRKGQQLAAVTVVEFADFQCPFCKTNAGLPDQLLQEFPNDVQFAFKHFPLGKHPQAQQAARASWAAHQQGKFWEFHDVVYAGDTQDLSPDVLRRYAEQIGLDMAKFDADLASPASAQAVAMDKMLGKSFKVGGTPAYYVNGKRVQTPSAAAVRAKVQQEIEAFRSQVKP